MGTSALLRRLLQGPFETPAQFDTHREFAAASQVRDTGHPFSPRAMLCMALDYYGFATSIRCRAGHSSDVLWPCMQVFKPYGSPYTLPIPTALHPIAVTTAPSINYPDVASGGLMALANASTNFGLRFSGEGLAEQQQEQAAT